jgi:hypothetical protein
LFRYFLKNPSRKLSGEALVLLLGEGIRYYSLL